MNQRGILMKHRAMNLIFIILSIFILTGCWDRTELQDLDIVTAIGIDKGEGDVENRYRVTIQIANEGQVIGGSSGAGVEAAPITSYSSTGSTIMEALRKISPMTANELFYPHVQVLAIGEDLAKEGIKDIFDFVEREMEFRMLFPVLIVRENTAENLLKINTPLETLPSAKIVGGLEFTRKIWGEYASTRADKVINNLGNEGLNITGIEIIGNVEKGNDLENIKKVAPDTSLEIKGVAIFKEGKFKQWLDEDAARGVTWINNEITSTIINLDCKDKKKALAIELMRSKTRIHAEVTDEKPIIYITIREEGEVSEVQCPMDLDKRETIDKLEKQLEEETKQEVMLAIKGAQEEQSDIFHFFEMVNRADPKYAKRVQDKWDDEIFPELEVKVNVNAFIRRTGMRTKPYLSE
jgi:spore germination protein KC